jgi:hypothetical protein
MKTPLERLLRETPDYTFFKVFGCACWPHLRPYNNHKLDFRSKKCVFLGYSTLHKGYKCLHVPSNRVYISRDVIFDETVFPFSNMPVSHTPPPVTESSLLSADHFMDTAYAPSLLANHGAGTGRGARLELLSEDPPLHVDPQPMHGLHGVPAAASGSAPVHGVESSAAMRPPVADSSRSPDSAPSTPESARGHADPSSDPLDSSPGAPSPLSATDPAASASPVEAGAPPDSPVAAAPAAPVNPTVTDPSAVAATGPTTRARRGIRQPKIRTDGTVTWSAILSARDASKDTVEPSDYRAALRLPHWRAAMETEFSALQRNGTWNMVPMSLVLI